MRTARAFHFTLVPVDGGTVWHVRRAGRFIGIIEGRAGCFYASRPPGEMSPRRVFAYRTEAAAWLGDLAQTEREDRTPNVP